MGKHEQRRAEREAQVLNTITALGRSVTLYELADFMHLQPSTWLRKLVHKMVDKQQLVFIEAQHRPNNFKRLYMLPSQHINMQQERLF